MKSKFLKFGMPIGVGLILASISIMGLLSTTLTGCSKPSCPSGQVMGTDQNCYSCASGYTATTSPSGNCSAANHGTYCCSGSGGSGGSSGCGSVMGCCPTTGCTPPNSWYGSSTALCYATSNDCHNDGNGTCRQCY